MLRRAENPTSLRQTRTDRAGHVFDGTQFKEDNPHQIALLDLVPRIQSRARDAVAVDRVDVFFFQRKLSGRRCSCFIVESSPDGKCQVCYGTGIVGGYTKFGTDDFTIDVTHPVMRSVNIRPLFELATRPVLFGLDNNATNGFIETEVPIRQNKGVTDFFNVVVRTSNTTKNNKIEVFVKNPNEVNFVPISYESLTSRLAIGKIQLRIEFARKTLSDPNPILSHIFVRYKLLDNLTVRVDLPRDRESIALREFGVMDNWTTINAYFDSTIGRVGVEDFIFRCRDQERFKIIDASPNRPLNIITSHDTTMRVIQGHEPYSKVPIGNS